MKTKNKTMLLLLPPAFIAAVFISLYFGSVYFPPKEILRMITGAAGDGVNSEIFWKLRLPRTLLGIFIGGGLAACGVVFQSVLRNPLAEPFTLGISGGGALGVAAGLVLHVSGYGITAFALCGCILSIVIVYTVASEKGFSNDSLILGGVILNFLFSSLVILLLGLSGSPRVKTAMIWLMGDISSAPFAAVPFVAAAISLAVAVLFAFSRELDLLTLGAEKARYLGLDAEKFKKFVFLLVSVVVGMCVSVSGVIGFIGLMIPHFGRKIAGPAHALLLPVSFFSGATFFVLCDTFARNILQPVELPVGIVTGAVGGIFFIILLMRTKSWEMFR
jgi:iron complex transport system permease protein